MSSKHRAPRRPKPHLYLVLAVVTVLAVAGGLVMFWPPGPEPRAAGNPGSSNGRGAEAQPLPGADRIVFYGHSMPTGGGASDPDLGYAEVVADATGLQLLNRAEGGTMSGTAADTMAALPAAGPRDVIVIHTGMNDVFRRGAEAAAMGRDAVRQLLTGSSTAGRTVLVLECQPFSWLDTPPAQELQAPYEAWNAMLREEAAAVPGVEVLETCAAWDPQAYTDVPKYHPNDDGHALLAEELVELLRAG